MYFGHFLSTSFKETVNLFNECFIYKVTVVHNYKQNRLKSWNRPVKLRFRHYEQLMRFYICENCRYSLRKTEKRDLIGEFSFLHMKRVCHVYIRLYFVIRLVKQPLVELLRMRVSCQPRSLRHLCRLPIVHSGANSGGKSAHTAQ